MYVTGEDVEQVAGKKYLVPEIAAGVFIGILGGVVHRLLEL